MLFVVRNFFLMLFFVLAAAVCASSPLQAADPAAAHEPGVSQAAEQQPPVQSPPQPQAPAPPSQPNAAPQPAPASPPLPVIVLDPAHGGTDTGARGENGLAEKDVVLQIARTLQAQLITHGFHVVMTRTDDSNPSYDDRDAIANAYRNAVFITIHIGSAGKMGTVRAYYDQISPAIQQVPEVSQSSAAPRSSSGTISAKLPANTLISWQQAQLPYVDTSHRLADILQLQFAQMFPGSPVTSTAAPLRDLRSVAEPAVAIEISSIAAPSADALLELSGPLSIAIEKSIETFRQQQLQEAP
jgi:N-acetylmuramoyl-L-alanine amidase